MSLRSPSIALLLLIGCPLEAERTGDKPADTGDTACSIQSFWFDDDADGYGNPALSIEVCELPAGYADNDGDCDDSASSVNPAAAEVCDNIDNDCEGTVDESAIDAPIWYQDLDDDGFGNGDVSVAACAAPTDYIATANDCNDLDSADTTAAIWYTDSDDDGWGAEQVVACDQPAGTVPFGGDCDDADALTNPGAAEVCNGLDEDCDSEIDEEATDFLVWYADHDDDGYGLASESTMACEPPEGFVELSTDCDDTTTMISPGAVETCSGLDEDCDGLIDDEDPNATGIATWFLDTDGDGYGVATASVSACAQPVGYAVDATDCDDANSTTFPGADETCDSTDEDCDGDTDESAIDAIIWYADVDGDTYGDSTALLTTCEQPADYVDNADDCDDLDASASPEGAEICDGFDQDCDGEVDEQTWYADNDGDGYGDADSIDTTCVMPSGFASNWNDCDDTNAAISPSGTETCGGQDEDCDGLTDDADDSVTGQTAWYSDLDGDGFGTPTMPTEACLQPYGHVFGYDDCDDLLDTVNPNALEVCDDGVDNDCEGHDESCFVVATVEGIDFVNVAASTFEMGCTGGQSNCQGDETLHTVTLTQDYHVSKTEVTQAQFEDVMGYNPSTYADCGDDCPVEALDWHESAAFANALSTAENLELCYTCTGSGASSECSVAMDPYDCDGYRMLTEAEWEGAARCGEDLLYAGSTTVDDVAWYVDNSSGITHAVAGKAPNACGLYDMSGNVYEWTQDWYDSLSSSAATDPTGAVAASLRIFRGGSWYNLASNVRVSYRNSYPPANLGSNVGLRIAKSNPRVVTLQGIDFVNVPASTFEMGCTAGQSSCESDETLHTVTLTQDYYVSESEVTQGQFRAVMGYNPSAYPACGDDCPVESVDWHESAAFANTLSTSEGLELCYACTGSGASSDCSVTMDPYDCGGYRLLTEAEWEGAARCGEDLLYAGSGTVGDVAIYSGNSSASTEVVGEKNPNACGLYDMSGNVWEWTQDWYDTLSSSAASDPFGAASGSNRVNRGGAWNTDASYLRVANRGSYGPPIYTGPNVGFRVARSNP